MDTLISHMSPKSPISEAYRTLRTNVQFSDLDRDIQTIVFTSALPGEGKTTTASNYGVVSAKAGKRVLIIDADMRKPTLHRVFRQPNVRGLSDALLSEKTALTFVLPTDEPRLDVMTSGPIPPNPAEILGSKKMRALIDEVKEHYDLILFDAPPVGVVTDAQILASFLDGTIVILRVGKGDRKQAQYAVELLRNVKANVLGVVLNRLPIHEGGYYKYKYYHYYSGSYDNLPETPKKGLFGRKKTKNR